MKLTVADIECVDARRPTLQQTISKAPGRRADIETDLSGRIDRKRVQRRLELQSAATHEAFTTADLQLDVDGHPRTCLFHPLPLHEDEPGHQSALGALAGFAETTVDEERVKAHFFGIVRHANWVQSPRSFPHATRLSRMSDSDLKPRIKAMMVENLMLKMQPEDIGDDTLLFAPEGLALDSIDALELAVGLEKHFGVATPNADIAKTAFVSVNTIADFVRENS